MTREKMFMKSNFIEVRSASGVKYILAEAIIMLAPSSNGTRISTLETNDYLTVVETPEKIIELMNGISDPKDPPHMRCHSGSDYKITKSHPKNEAAL